MTTISSACPPALANYAWAASAGAAILEAEARRLEAVLDAFAARCTEYSVPAVGGLPAHLFTLARHEDELAAWVGAIGAGFQRADSATLDVSVDYLANVSAAAAAVYTQASFAATSTLEAGEEIAQAAVALVPWAHIQAALADYYGAATNLYDQTVDFAEHAWTTGREMAWPLFLEWSGIADFSQAMQTLGASMGDGLAVLGRITELYGVDGAVVFTGQVLWETISPLTVFPGVTLQELAELCDDFAWNFVASLFYSVAAIANQVNALPDGIQVPVMVAAAPVLITVTTVGGLTMAELIIVGDGPRWAYQNIGESSDMLELFLQGFWYEGAGGHLDPRLFRAIAAEIDQLQLGTCAQLGRCEVPAGDPPTPPHAGTQTPAASYSSISYNSGEEVRLERLNGAGDYRLSIAGLNPTSPGAPNNFEAVTMTAEGMTEGNHYYEYVKAQVLAELERLPPGSTLHLEGHSMGGGMCFLLRDDPEIQQRLLEAGITCGSLITFGAVRPKGSAQAPEEPDNPFTGAEERHYVNADDSLALNVGAGHEGYAGVVMLDDGRPDDPTAAHTDYSNPDHYSDVPSDVQTMPYEVDEGAYVAYTTP